MKTMGIDIGGSKIRAVLCDGKRVLKTREIKTPAGLYEFEEALSLLATWGNTVHIGVAAPSVISGNKIIKSPNIKYLKDFEFSGIPVDSDARCFARAELSSKRRGNVLFITFGTGIGRAVAKNGKIQVVKKFEYPENWEKPYQKLRGGFKDNFDGRLAQFLAKNILDFAKPYAPDAIVLGGGVTSRSNFFPIMKREFASLGARFVINRAKFGKNSVAIGAAMLAVKK